MTPKQIFSVLTERERLVGIGATLLFLSASLIRAAVFVKNESILVPVASGTYREGIVGQPIAVNPVISDNPVDFDLAALVYSTLGDLTTSYELQDDGRVLLIKIKEGVRWSDGAPLTADDVIFTIRALQNPRTRSPWAAEWHNVSAERVSELQVRLATQELDIFFLKNTAKLVVLPQHIFGTVPPENLRLSGYNLEPVGSGPFLFAGLKMRKGGFITEYRLVRNEVYHGEKPFIKKITFKFYNDEVARVAAFRLREIDGFGAESPDALPAKNRRTAIEIIPSTRYYAVFFNGESAGLIQNKELRTALRDAIDKATLVQAIAPGGFAVAAKGPTRFMQTPPPPDRTRLETLKDKGESIHITLTVPKVPFLEKTAAVLKNQWEKSGADEITIASLPLDEIIEKVVKTKNYELLLFGNVPSEIGNIAPFWRSTGAATQNLGRYGDAEVDALFDTIRTAPDPTARARAVEAVEARLEEDVPAAFLYSLPYLYVHTNKLRGFVAPAVIAEPRERFAYVARWYVATARTIKPKTD